MLLTTQPLLTVWVRDLVLDWFRSSVDTCHISPCLRDHHTDIWQSQTAVTKLSSIISSKGFGKGALSGVSLNKRRTHLHHPVHLVSCAGISWFSSGKHRWQFQKTSRLLMNWWTGIITARLLDPSGSLHTTEQPFLSVNTPCLARCQRSEGHWKRGKNEKRWDSPWHCCSWQLSVSAWRLTGLSNRLGQHSCVC